MDITPQGTSLHLLHLENSMSGNVYVFDELSALVVFQKFMENFLADYRDHYAAPCLDDVLIYSKSFEDHINQLQQILQPFKEIKLKLSKSSFFQKQVRFCQSRRL